MLVLSRKKDQSIVINDNIVIVVVDVRGDRVRLGIQAPKDVPVDRKEVHDAKRRSPEGALEEVLPDSGILASPQDTGSHGVDPIEGPRPD
jgi:carbon storage regulator